MSDKIKVTRKVTTKSPKLKSPKTVKLKSPKLDSPKPKLATMSSTAAKETIYVDVDDEITAIIDRVQQAKGKIIALVLPKRASVMQSVVNMKLLKRTAEQAGKHLVLITSEASLLPLAGIVGMYMAETPTSKPEIPPSPDRPSDEPEQVDEPMDITDNSGTAVEDFDSDAAAQTPVGELAGTPAKPAEEAVDEVVMESSDELTNEEKPDVVPVKKNKKLAVPNFDKFRLRMFLGFVMLVVLVAGWIFATKVLPKATIAITTNSQVVRSNVNLTLDTAAKTADTENKIIPAIAQTTPKTSTQQVAATGQQNNGEKASGKITLTNCSSSGDPITVPAGTGLTSNGMTYITQSTALLETSSFSGGGVCKSYADTSATVTVIALKPGASYNIDSSSFTSPISSVTAKSTTPMSGGTDNIVKVVSQSDIDSAKSKIAAQDTAQLKKDLQAALQGKGLLPIPSTFIAGDQQLTTSANVGDTADTVTVTAVVPYTMLGIHQADLRKLVVASVNGQIDTKKQKILDDGVAKATFSQQSPGTPTTATVAVKAQTVAGPELSVDDIKRQVAGKKEAAVKQSLGSLPGVTDVQVTYSPFWVSSVPQDMTKITIDIAKPTN